MTYIKAPTKSEQKYYDFLERLRQSGDTNMFGAPPYLQAAFGLGRAESIQIVSAWMNGHNNPELILEGPSADKSVKPGKFVTRYEVSE